MPSRKQAQRLEDILDNIGLIKEYTRGASYDGFLRDRKTQDAGERCLARISEAASKLEGSAKALIPDQPWSEIRALGNIIRHEYDTIDTTIIWNIINRDLNSLQSSIESALNTLRNQPPNPI